MDKTEKTVLLVGGLGLVAVLFFSWMKQQSANQQAYLNEPGLTTQPSVGAVANNALSSLIGTASAGLGSSLGSLFSNLGSQIGSESNDPGLDTSDVLAYPGDTYTASNSSSYGTSTGATDTEAGLYSEDFDN
jgi:hypothetical protein